MCGDVDVWVVCGCAVNIQSVVVSLDSCSVESSEQFGGSTEWSV